MSALLSPHSLKIALLQPRIAPNTGNIGRLCVASGAALHLVRPLGFILSDSYLRRSGMDYWPRLRLTIHDDDTAFFKSIDPARVWLFTSKADRPHWQADFSAADTLIFGNETRGLSDSILTGFSTRQLRIPQMPDERCLNLSTAVGIGLYEALRQVARRR